MREAFYNRPGLFESERGLDLNTSREVYRKAARILPLERLQGLRKLGFLSVIQRGGDIRDFRGFDHDALEHTLLVPRAAELILEEAGFPENIINEVIVAGLLHDIALPAGGEAVVRLDPENLDEENHWRDVLSREQLFQLIFDLGLDPVHISMAIKNNGIVGKVLDIADRIAYTTVDSSYFYGKRNAPPYLYKTVKIDVETGTVYFDYPEALGKFLQLRAENHFNVYNHPVNKGADFMIRTLLRPLYSTDGTKPLSPSRLRQMTDDDLCEVLQEVYQLPFPAPWWIHRKLVNLYPNYTEVGDEEDAHKYLEHLAATDSFLPLGYEQSWSFDPGTSYMVKDPLTGRVLPFRELLPDQADLIEDYAKVQTYIVYYYNIEENNERNRLVRELFEKPHPLTT